MIKNTVNIIFTGGQLKPSFLKEAFKDRLNILADPSIIAQKGRYKGQNPPYGIANMVLEEEPVHFISLFENTISEIEAFKATLHQAEVERIELDFTPIDESYQLPSLSNQMLIALNRITYFGDISVSSNYYALYGKEKSNFVFKYAASPTCKTGTDAEDHNIFEVVSIDWDHPALFHKTVLNETNEQPYSTTYTFQQLFEAILIDEDGLDSHLSNALFAKYLYRYLKLYANANTKVRPTFASFIQQEEHAEV